MSALVYDLFRILGCMPTSVLASAIHERISRNPSGDDEHPVAIIRHFISSRSLNDIYFFLSCLSCLDPILWAGEQSTGEPSLLAEPSDTGEEDRGPVIVTLKPVLDQWEVERIISSLEIDDEGIRELVSHLSSVPSWEMPH